MLNTLTIPTIKDKVVDYVKRYGRNSMSSLLMYEGLKYYMLKGVEGFIGYYDMPKLLIGIGEPICRMEDYENALLEFVRFGEKLHKDCSFMIVTDPFAEMARKNGFGAIQIGEDFIFDVQSYAPKGDHAKKVRSATNQVKRLGVVVKEYHPDVARDKNMEDQFIAIAHRWMHSRKFKYRAYFIGLKLFDMFEIKRYFYLESFGRIVALLTCLPIYERNGYLFEDLIRDPSAPNGASELMILEALRKFREEGKLIATFGISPKLDLTFADGIPSWSRMIAGVCIPFVNRLLRLQSLHHHRKKFHTQNVEKIFLMKYPKRLRIADVTAILKSFNSMS